MTKAERVCRVLAAADAPLTAEELLARDPELGDLQELRVSLWKYVRYEWLIKATTQKPIRYGLHPRWKLRVITATTLEGSHVCVPEAQFEAFIAAWERANGTCVWQQDGEGSWMWKTKCGQWFSIDEDGSPSDCEMAFCCFCGLRLQESLSSDEDEAEEGGR